MDAETWYWQRTWSDFRRGDAAVSLHWPGGQGLLPLALPVVHVAWSGDMIMGAQALPLGIAEDENQVRLVRPGDLAYDPKHDEITLTYGTAEARLPSGPNTLTVIGGLLEGLDEFARWAGSRRFEGVGELRFERVETMTA